MTFTRAQRLTVAFTESFLDMVVSIAFFEQAEDLDADPSAALVESVPVMLGRALQVALQSCLITITAAVILNWIFQ